MPFLPQRSIATQVRVALGLLMLLMSLGSLGLLLLARRASHEAARVHREHLEPMLRLMEVSEAYSVDLTMALRGVRGGRMEPTDGIRKRREGQVRARVAWGEFKSHRGAGTSLERAEAQLAHLERLGARMDDLLPLGLSRELGSFGDAEWLPAVGACAKELQQLREEEARLAKDVIQSLNASTRRATAGGLALMGVALILALGVGQGLANHLRQGVEDLVEHLRSVADGHLEPVALATGQGELLTAGRELNRTVVRLRQLMTDLQAQKALERSILDGAHAAIIGLDLEGRVTRWNRAAEAILGYSAEEVVGKATPQLWRQPEELAKLAQEVGKRLGRVLSPGIEALQAAASIPGFATECHYISRDGSLVPVLLSISQVRNPDGELLGTMGVALDLRDVERLKAALQASEARYQRLAEHLPAVIYQTQVWPDARRTWPFLSPRFEDLFGLPNSAWAECPDYPISKIHPEDLPGYLHLHQEATRTLSPMTWEGRAFTERPGEMKWIRARSNPTPQPDGSLLWDGLMEDVTLLKQGEESLRRSEARAQEASRAKSAFLASMSHELRTPLSAILGYSRLMAREPLRSEEDRAQLDHVLKAGEHLLSLINDVLSLSKIEAGRMEVKCVPFDLTGLVRELESLFRLTALGKGLAFEAVTRGLPPQVEGDPAKLRQVLVNLLGNALKFTTRGQVRLEASWSGEVLTAMVQDTGPGIPVDEQEALFGAFNQTSQGQAIGGTGLGLHISQALVALMGGQIGFTSVPGEGSRFFFRVPLPESDHLPLLSAQGRVLHLEEDELPRHILVVDDRPENRDILDRLLGLVGFRCSLAEHGRAALDQWREGHPDLVLLDLRMPVMDGFETIVRLRELEGDTGRARTPVIAISASVYDVSTEDLLRRGFDAFLTKPIEEEQLFSALEKHLGLSFRRAEAQVQQVGGEALAGLKHQSPDWLVRFQEEVLTGDLESAETLLLELRDAPLAEALRRCLRVYNVEIILQHLR